MRGRKPKPTESKRRAGNPGKRPLNDREPKGRKGRPRQPRDLKDFGKTCWKALCEELEAMGLLTTADRFVMEMYCWEWQLWKDARKEIAKKGLVCETERGARYQEPAVGIASSAVKRMQSLGAELGLSPAARTRLRLEADEKELDPYAGLKDRTIKFAG